MTSENYIILALIIGVIGFFWLITTMREKADQQQLVMEKMERLREARERREQNILLVYNALLSYAVKNGKVNYVAYDIEEGGQYMKEVNDDRNLLRKKFVSLRDILKQRHEIVRAFLFGDLRPESFVPIMKSGIGHIILLAPQLL